MSAPPGSFPSIEIAAAGFVMSWMLALPLKFAKMGHVAVAAVVHGATGAAPHELAMMLPFESALQYFTPSDVIELPLI